MRENAASILRDTLSPLIILVCLALTARVYSLPRELPRFPPLHHPFPPFSLLPLSFPISLIVKADVFDYIPSRALVRLAADRSKFSHARNPRGSELRRWPHIIIGGCEKISTRRNTPGFLSLSRSFPVSSFFLFLSLSPSLSFFFIFSNRGSHRETLHSVHTDNA